MIGFVGLSHLGIVSSVAAASKEFNVTAYDTNQSLCEALSRGKLPVSEPNLSELLAKTQNRLQFTSDPVALKSCDVIYFSQDIPTDENNCSDLVPLQSLINKIIPYIKPRATLVVLSQVPPGFTRQLSESLQTVLKRLEVKLFYQVETLIFGRAVERATQPERFMVGCKAPKDALPLPYAEFLAAFDCPILLMRYESAELSKISINIFLAASLSATNTLAEVCEKTGADWSEVIPALRLDRRIGPHAYLTPGLGIAGGNIERDLVTVKKLAADYGADDVVPSAFLSQSQYRKQWVLRMLHSEVLSKVDNPIIAIWGLTYKPDTASIKNSPTLVLLEGLNGITIRLYDPQAVLQNNARGITQESSPLEACRGAHALVIMTAWEEFASIAPAAVKEALVHPVILDPSGSWREKSVSDEEIHYFTLGKNI